MKLSYIKQSINTRDNEAIKNKIETWVEKDKATQVEKGLWMVDYKDDLGNSREAMLFFHENEATLMV